MGHAGQGGVALLTAYGAACCAKLQDKPGHNAKWGDGPPAAIPHRHRWAMLAALLPSCVAVARCHSPLCGTTSLSSVMSMTLDVRTMLLMQLLSAFATAVFLLLAQRGQPHSAGITRWAWAYLVLTAGLVLTALRGLVPDFLSIVLANSLAFLSFTLMLEGIVAELALVVRFRRRLWLATAAVVLLFALGHLLGFDYEARVQLISCLLALMTLFTAIVLLRGCQANAPARKVLGGSFALMAGLFFGRAVFTMAGLNSRASLDDRSVVESAHNAALFLLMYGNAVGFMLMARERLVRDLVLLASTDALTGAYNRHAFAPIAGAALAQIERHHLPVSLLLIDLDHFKAINDQFGHLAGDEVLKGAAAIIARELRGGDALSRFGGEEMLVLLPAANADAAQHVAERVRQQIEVAAFASSGNRIAVTASIGVATAQQKVTLGVLIEAADQAMYSAKTAGRNQVHHYAGVVGVSASGATA